MLPAILREADGSPITDADRWRRRREQLLSAFADEIYGPAVTPDPVALHRAHRVVASSSPAPGVLVLAHAPVAEAMLDPDGRWGRREVTARGWTWAVLTPSEVFADGVPAGQYSRHLAANGPRSLGTGVLSGWASAVSAVVDELQAGLAVGPIAVVGQSRLGKVALLAGARDPRIAAVVASQSGLGGAAPMRETQSSRPAPRETPADAFARFPHWFGTRFGEFAARPEDLSVEQHQLIALCAPRPVLIFNAVEDHWVDPAGQREALRAALPVWDLWPDAPRPVSRLRPGPHAILPADWPGWLEQLTRWWSRSEAGSPA